MVIAYRPIHSFQSTIRVFQFILPGLAKLKPYCYCVKTINRTDQDKKSVSTTERSWEKVSPGLLEMNYVRLI